MKNYFTLLFILTALTFSACKKGENGADGLPGAKGEQGLKGADGSTMHSGTGAPAPNLGNTGDFYFDKTTAELYGPKTATAWPTPISLKGSTGATGATGTAGSKILSGTTTPALSVGAEGDFYFDTANLAFYGPKTANSWGSAVSLKASNAVTTFLYNNQSFDNVILENPFPGGSPTSYSFNASKIINISHETYTNAYNRGIVYIRLKFSNDNGSSWAAEIYKSSGDMNFGYYYELYLGDDNDSGIIKSNGVTIEGNQYTQTDINGNGLKNLKFDVKVVCIPAGTVVQMSAKNIDVKDVKAVAKYLNL